MSGDGSQHPSAPGSIPPGWYADPAGGGGKRWWDGTVWTANVREPEAAQPAPSTFGAYVPPERRQTIPLRTGERGIAYTRASWWIAGSPFWIVLPQVIVFEAIDSLTPLPRLTLATGIALATGVALVILVILAFVDRRALTRGGNESAASPWWTLLTPLAYLIARARQTQFYATGGWASVLWWCIAMVLTPGVAVLVFFAVVGTVG
jgi:hypothetical protein